MRLEEVSFWIAALFIVAGFCILTLAVFGTYRFNYVLNRMHAAAMGDTLGIGSILIGVMILNGLDFITLKVLFILLFLWCASPVSSHLISRLEVTTNKELEKKCEVERE